jgi:hypothetical protein
MCPSIGSEVFFHIQRQLDHALQQLFRGYSLEVFTYQLFGEQARYVADFEGVCF